MEIWESKPPGTLWDTPGLLRGCFTVTFTFTFYKPETKISQFFACVTTFTFLTFSRTCNCYKKDERSVLEGLKTNVGLSVSTLTVPHFSFILLFRPLLLFKISFPLPARPSIQFAINLRFHHVLSTVQLKTVRM